MLKCRYFRPEGDILEACRSWRERWEKGRQAANEFALSMGATRVRFGFEGQLAGLEMAAVLDGWKRAAGRDCCAYPVKGKAGDAARAALAALPTMPSPWELAELLGHRGTVSYKYQDGYGSSGVGGLYPVELVWDGEDVALVVVDPEPRIAEILAQHPDAEIEGRWMPPAGLVEITKAQWNLVVAQNEVAREAAAAYRAELETCGDYEVLTDPAEIAAEAAATAKMLSGCAPA